MTGGKFGTKNEVSKYENSWVFFNINDKLTQYKIYWREHIQSNE